MKSSQGGMVWSYTGIADSTGSAEKGLSAGPCVSRGVQETTVDPLHGLLGTMGSLPDR